MKSTLNLAAVILLATLATAGCQSPDTPSAADGGGNPSGSSLQYDEGLDGPDRSGSASAAGGIQPVRSKPIAGSGVASSTAAPFAPKEGSWGIVIITYANDGHKKAAESACADVVRRYPALADAYVVSKNTGSAVFVGRYKSPDEQGARTRLKAVKEIQEGENRPFLRAMLTRGESSNAPIGKNDLRQVRVRNPDEHPLYTLQVAVWSDLQSGELTLAQIRDKAETQAAQLRARGFTAFYHHDDHRKMSIVTIGVFNAKAYDPRSTLFAPEVESLLKQFPQHLVNGEPLLVQVAPTDPTNMKPQQCRLVEIPR